MLFRSRRVNGDVHESFHDACFALGLLDDDKEYIAAIEEAFVWASGRYVRQLFCMLLMSNSMSRPSYVWDNTWHWLCEGILYNIRNKMKNDGMFSKVFYHYIRSSYNFIQICCSCLFVGYK